MPPVVSAEAEGDLPRLEYGPYVFYGIDAIRGVIKRYQELYGEALCVGEAE